MFDIGFPELLILAIVVLLVFGPDRLPEVLRTVGGWMGKARRSAAALRAEIEREVGADEIRRDLHNQRILDEAKQVRREVSATRDEVEEMLGRRYGALQESGQVAPRAGSAAERGDASAAPETEAPSATSSNAAATAPDGTGTTATTDTAERPAASPSAPPVRSDDAGARADAAPRTDRADDEASAGPTDGEDGDHGRAGPEHAEPARRERP